MEPVFWISATGFFVYLGFLTPECIGIYILAGTGETSLCYGSSSKLGVVAPDFTN